MTQHIYAILKSRDDWTSLVEGNPHLWSYDRAGTLRVEPEVLSARAATNVWTESGWDSPPRTYPALAIRELHPAPPAPSVRKRPAKRKTLKAELRLIVALETPEQLDCLCEAYHASPGVIVSRLIAEAYRRDVVESGMIALLAEDDIIAPHP